jgi:uncharacterized membrane protein (DUF106 family)
MGTIKAFKTLLINIISVVFFILIFAGLLLFCWNAGVVWLIPGFGGMGYSNALALTVAGVIIHVIFDFWSKRFMAMKVVKTLDSIARMEKALTEKGIL